MKTYKILLTFFILTFAMLGCEDNELDQTNPNVIQPNGFLKNSRQLQASVNAAYSYLQTQGMYGRIAFFLLDNLGQDNDGTGSLQGGLRSILEYTFTPATSEFFTYWESAYRGIYACNYLIEAAANNQIENVEQNEINERLGEVHFLRALYYFYLTNLWGNVPLQTTAPLTTAELNSSSGALAPQNEIYQLIIDDLTFAKANLPAVGDTSRNGRATSGAAQALLGKTYLFLEQWQNAANEFSTLNGYTIVGVDLIDNGNVAGEFNSESIFEVNYDQAIGGDQWATDGRGIRETTFRGIEYSGNFRNIIVNANLFNEYESDDPRIQAYMYQNGDTFNNGMNTWSGLTDPIWRKYQNLDTRESDGFEYSGINFRVIRYADVLLMWAEAENELGNTGTAVGLMNQVRTRAGMPLYGTAEMDSRGFPVNNQSEVFDAIVHERAVELAGEQIRFFDLKRWDLAASTLNGFQTGKHERLPIPQREIDANPDLTNADQNPGY